METFVKFYIENLFYGNVLILEDTEYDEHLFNWKYLPSFIIFSNLQNILHI